MASLFLVFEGMDGGGKTTQIERLAAWLASTGIHPVLTREPGGTAIGERIRAILLDPRAAEMSAKVEALLYAADRAQHVAEVILPALDAGRVVISDRYLDSSLAYQGLARGLGLAEVLGVNTWASGGVLPDLVLLLDVPAELGRSRSQGAGSGSEPRSGPGAELGGTDRIEAEGSAFHASVARAYRALAGAYPHRFAVIDAAGTPDAVEAAIRHRVEPLLAGVGRA